MSTLRDSDETRDPGRGRRRAVRVVVVVVVVLAAWAVWSAVETYRVAAHLHAAELAQTELRTAIEDEDFDRARTVAAGLAEHASIAATAANSLPLRLAALLPLVGSDVQALQTTTGGLDVLAREVVPPLLDAGAALLPAELTSGEAIDLAAISAQAPVVRAAATAIARQRDQVLQIDADSLVPPLRDPVRRVQAELTDLTGTVELLASTTEQLPGMLGADGARNYVLVVQNLAEARPSGGIVGAWAQLELDKGSPRLVATGTEDDFTRLTVADVDVPADVSALYGADLGLIQNVNLTPDFPLSARLVSDIWAAQGRPAPDGVIAVDPEVLASVMTVTGPVDVPGGPTLDSSNVAPWLMRDVYDSLGGDSDLRRSYLGTVTGAVFARLAVSPDVLLTAGRAIADGGALDHVHVWAADEAEEQLLVDAGVSGALPSPTPAAVGAYVTNADGSKLDYWLSGGISVHRSCTTERLSLEVTLTNEAPAEVPTYMANQLRTTGDELTDLAPGARSADTEHVVVVSLFLPPERGVSGLLLDGQEQGFATGTESGWTVVRVSVTLAEATSTLSFELLGSSVPPTDVMTQAALNPFGVDTTVPPC